jgi:serine/threonine protein kinase
MYLPKGTLLLNRYAVERVIGQGGFGITYLAQDIVLNVPVAVKEYLPRQLATRAEGATHVSVFSGEAREHFHFGLKKFLEEARSVARFANHPNIVSARDYFEANGTAYMVMEYIEGVTFKQFLDQKGGRIPFDLAKRIMLPVMDALGQVHNAGLLHRDISPDNIYLTADGQVKLLDFGAARQQAGEHSRSLSVILKAGYAPEEQYRSRGRQGAWTDVYAVAATLYRAITGLTPPEALDRKEEDTLQPPSRLGTVISPSEEQALLKALAVSAPHRFQSMREFQEALQTGIVLTSSIPQPYPAAAALTQPPPASAPSSSRPAGWTHPVKPVAGRKSSATAMAVIFSVAAIVLVLGGGATIWHFARNSSQAIAIQGTTTVPEKAKIPASPEGSKVGSIPATPRTPDSPSHPTDTSEGFRREEVEKIAEKVRSAHLDKDINKFLSCYDSSYPNLGRVENQMLELWRNYDIKEVSYRISNVQRVSDNQAAADIVWNIQLYDHRTHDYTLVRQKYRTILEKGPGGWKIRDSKETAVVKAAMYQGNLKTQPGLENQDNPSLTILGPSFPWTSQRLVSELELVLMTKDDLLIMRNEILARHGMVFREPRLREHFERQSWYRPRGSLDNKDKILQQVMGELNPIEKKNLQFIMQYARRTGRI